MVGRKARKPTSATIGAKVNAPRKGALRKAAIQDVLTIAQCHNEIGLSRGLPQNFSRHSQLPRRHGSLNDHLDFGCQHVATARIKGTPRCGFAGPSGIAFNKRASVSISP